MLTKTPAPADVIIGGNIRAARTNSGMSQETLGKLVGVTFQQIQKYEKGTNRVGGSRMQQISEALKVSIEYLFQGTALGMGSPAIAYPTETRKAIAAFETLPRRQRSAALVMLQTMAGMPIDPEPDGTIEVTVDVAKGEETIRKMVKQGVQAGFKSFRNEQAPSNNRSRS